MSLNYGGYGLSLRLYKNKITYNADGELKPQTAHINDKGNFISCESNLGKFLKPLFEQLIMSVSDSEILSDKITELLSEIIKIIASDITCFCGEISNPLLRKIISYIIENYNKDSCGV